MTRRSLPKHSALAASLLAEIEAGRFQPGDLLPTEAELSKRFEVSRHTVRMALRSLYEKGLVISRQGRGSMVQSTSTSPRYSYACDSIEDLLQYVAATPRTVEHVARVRVDDNLAAWIGCEPGYFWWAVHTTRLNEECARTIASSMIYVPDAFAAAVAELPRSSLPLFVLMERRYGHQIAQIRQSFSVASATMEEARELSLGAGAPVMCVERRFIDERGGLLEVSRSVHPADTFQYRMTVRQIVGPSKEKLLS